MLSMAKQPDEKRRFASVSSTPFQFICFPEENHAEEGPTVCTLYAVTHKSGTGPYIDTCRHVHVLTSSLFLIGRGLNVD
jgi:hypothetical protein